MFLRNAGTYQPNHTPLYTKAFFDTLFVFLKKSVECIQLRARGMTVLYNTVKDESIHLLTFYD